MPSAPGTVNYPASLDDAVSLIDAGNGVSSTLAADVLAGATTVQPTSTTGWPTSGSASIFDPVAGDEIIYYNGIVGGVLQAVLKGREGTSDLAHAAVNVTAIEERVTGRHHTVLRDAIIAAETELGVGARASTIFARRSGVPPSRTIVLPNNADYGIFERLFVSATSSVEIPANGSVMIYSSDPPPSVLSTRVATQNDGAIVDSVVAGSSRVLLNTDATAAGTVTANSSDEFNLAVQTRMEITNSQQNYEKCGIIVQSHTYDPSGGGATIGTLSGTLSTGAPITSLPVNALAADYGGGQLTLTSGANTQTWIVTQSARAGDTSLTVVSQTPNFAYTSGTALVDNTFRDCVGIDMRGSIYGTIQTGRAWGAISEADILPGANGYLVAHEFQMTNAGSDQPAMGTNTSKYGLHIVSKGSTGGPTAAIYIHNAAGSAAWHKGIFADKSDLGVGATDTFLELNGLWEVFSQTGQTVVGGATAGYSSTLLVIQGPNAVADPLVSIGNPGLNQAYSLSMVNGTGRGALAIATGGAFLSDAATGDVVLTTFTPGLAVRLGGSRSVVTVNRDNTLGFFGATSGPLPNLRSDTSGALVIPASGDYGLCERLMIGASASVEVPATSSLTIYNVS